MALSSTTTSTPCAWALNYRFGTYSPCRNNDGAGGNAAAPLSCRQLRIIPRFTSTQQSRLLSLSATCPREAPCGHTRTAIPAIERQGPAGAYLLTGLSGDITYATRSVICS